MGQIGSIYVTKAPVNVLTVVATAISALDRILSNHSIYLSEREILELFAHQESLQESGDYLKYRDVLKNVVHEFGKTFNFTPTESEANALAESIQNWEPFPDTIEVLKALKTRYKLTVISNIDDELFAYSAKKLEIEFD